MPASSNDTENLLSRWKRSYHVIGTENWYLLIFTHDNTDRVFSFEQFMIPSCETGHQLINLNLYRYYIHKLAS